MLTSLDPLLTLAIILTVGVTGGFFARRMGLPGCTGQIVAGIAIGHSGLELLGIEVLAQTKVVTSFALAFIAASVGAYLNVRRLHNAGKRLFLLLVTESTITPIVTWVAVVYIGGASLELGLLLATMAVSTAPATILAIVQETRSKGVFAKTLVAAVAFNNVACILLFEVARVLTRPETVGSAPAVLIDPFVGVLVAVAIGAGCGFALVAATADARERYGAKSLAALLAAAGLAEMLGLSSMLACLVLGATIANLAPRREGLGASAFPGLEGAIFAIFFTLAGMHLDFQHLIPAGFLTATVLGGRFVGKLMAANIAMRLAGATSNVRRFLGLGLIPQAGVAVGLILVISNDPAFAPFHQTILAVGLTTVMLNELLGPILTRHALERSGDFGRDRPRVIDFIAEENIEMDLRADSMEAAIQRLVDLLAKSNMLKMDKDAFAKAVLAREAESSTCIGEGLAVPHATLEGPDQIVGAIGISREGLPFDTPDGKPVHCIVLLGTTESLCNRHLEVLGALARAVSCHEDLGHRLFTARSPAHVYQLLHAEESEDFNQFLEEPS